MRESKKSKKLFVITRGTIFVYKDNRHHIHTKERGNVLDVYALLDNQHDFNFMISTDQCHGYWLDLSLLKLLKDSNIDFWDTLLKCAACDVITLYSKIITRKIDSHVCNYKIFYFHSHIYAFI